VECGLRKGNGPWRLGVASYQPEELYWFGVFGMSMRPQETFPRRDLTLVARRLPSDAEAASLGPGMIVVECQLGEGASGGDASDASGDGGAGGASGGGGGRAGGGRASGGRASGGRASGGRASGGRASGGRASGTVELALADSALTGLLSWLEAAPPGSDLDIAL
jgi:hypothetical protein